MDRQDGQDFLLGDGRVWESEMGFKGGDLRFLGCRLGMT